MRLVIMAGMVVVVVVVVIRELGWKGRRGCERRLKGGRVKQG